MSRGSARVTRVDWNEGAFAEIGQWASTAAHVAAAANAVAADAESNAPYVRGLLAGGFTASAGQVDGISAVSVVGSTYGGSIPAELGSVNNPPYGMVGKAIRAVGLHWDGER